MNKEAAYVHRSARFVITEDGQELPVTNMFDSNGDECDSVEQAVTCVAGPDKDGLWLSIDLQGMEKVPLQ